MYGRILVPVDGSPTAERGLGEAMALAAQLGSQLVLLHVVDIFPMTVDMAPAMAFEETRRGLVAYGEKVLQAARERVVAAGLACDTALREITSMRAADVIVEEAAKRSCGLIVMGTHGRHGLNRLALGSDAEMVLRESPVPLLLVRKP